MKVTIVYNMTDLTASGQKTGQIFVESKFSSMTLTIRAGRQILGIFWTRLALIAIHDLSWVSLAFSAKRRWRIGREICFVLVLNKNVSYFGSLFRFKSSSTFPKWIWIIIIICSGYQALRPVRFFSNKNS